MAKKLTTSPKKKKTDLPLGFGKPKLVSRKTCTIVQEVFDNNTQNIGVERNQFTRTETIGLLESIKHGILNNPDVRVQNIFPKR